jgi:putative flippase GtrA
MDSPAPPAGAPAPRLLGVPVPRPIARRLGPARLGVLQELARFTAVGALGFFVDAGTLRLGLMIGLGPWVGRLFSYLAAASFTYLLNRAWTFRARAGAGGAGQWARFLLVNLGGFLANYGAYALLLVTTETVARWPEIGVGAGALAGLLVNFSLSRRFVFKDAGPDRGAA